MAHGNPTDALDSLTLSIRDYYDCGSFSLMCGALALLAFVFDRLGHHEPAGSTTRSQRSSRPGPISRPKPGNRRSRKFTSHGSGPRGHIKARTVAAAEERGRTVWPRCGLTCRWST